DPRCASARGLFRQPARMGGEPGGAPAGRPDRALRLPACRHGGGAMKQTAKLKIWRGLDRHAGRWETYEIPFEPGQSVLDGVRWLRSHADPSLAIRFSCINANACKEC